MNADQPQRPDREAVDAEALDRDLVGYFRDPSAHRSFGDGEHPGPEVLATYAEGLATHRALLDEPGGLAGVEDHLAACRDCRRAMLEARRRFSKDLAAGPSRVLPPVTNRPRIWAWTRRPSSWGAIGMLAAACLLWIVSPRSGLAPAGKGDRDTLLRQLASSGSDFRSVETASVATLERAVAALEGRWPRPVALAELHAGMDSPVLRDSAGWRMPAVQEPRWSVVAAGESPVFRWRIPPGADAQELLFVDEDENLIATLTPPVDGSCEEQTLIQDRESASRSERWEAGGTYAWKVSVRVEGSWISSTYVPFRIASEAEDRALSRDLEEAGDSAFLQVVAYAAAGRYGQALERLRSFDSGRHDEIARSLLEEQHLPLYDLAAELERWRASR